jgi:hypothetical protein
VGCEEENDGTNKKETQTKAGTGRLPVSQNEDHDLSLDM